MTSTEILRSHELAGVVYSLPLAGHKQEEMQAVVSTHLSDWAINSRRGDNIECPSLKMIL